MRHSPIASVAAIALLIGAVSGCSDSEQTTTATTSPTPVPNGSCDIHTIDPFSEGGTEFANPPEVTSNAGLLTTKLDVKYTTDTQIAGCNVTLRSYNGRLVGDTLRAKPGDTLDITLVNDLPVGDDSWSNAGYNVTNLHTHGLHTSPTGKPGAWGDNVLLRIWPTGTPQSTVGASGDDGMTDVVGTAHYRITIPDTHPAGTFWYHAHAHGATAAQVSSGMEGAIIIEGGLDNVNGIKGIKENVFVFQQNVYGTAGTIEQPGFADFGPCTWEPSQRAHLINGQLFPTIDMSRNEVQRWRFIHGGVRESLTLELRGPDDGRTDKMTLPLVNLNEIAVDGIALGTMDSWPSVTLNPGYRSDVLATVPTSGTYYLVDGPSNDDSLTCKSTPDVPSLLAKVVVDDTDAAMTLPTTTDLATAAAGKNGKPNDLVTINPTQDPYSEGFLVPIGPIDTFQRVDFTVTTHPVCPPDSAPPQSAADSCTLPGNTPVQFLAADHPFDGRNARRLTLGNTDLWMVTTSADALYYAHPFHIHVNPFQTWRFKPDGKTPELVWRDTLLAPQGQTLYLYTYYTDFTGDFVYHCHILDHEDQGMMERVHIGAPGGASHP